MTIRQRVETSLRRIATVIFMLGFTVADAHLMNEQQGTLNFANGGAFLVLSLPISAFKGVDENQDSALSSHEMEKHTASMKEQTLAGVRLTHENGELIPLEGLLLSLPSSENNLKTPSTHFVALGRFRSNDRDGPFQLKITLWGQTASTQSLKIVATRDGQSQVMIFAPQHDTHRLFTSARK